MLLVLFLGEHDQNPFIVQAVLLYIWGKQFPLVRLHIRYTSDWELDAAREAVAQIVPVIQKCGCIIPVWQPHQIIAVEQKNV